MYVFLCRAVTDLQKKLPELHKNIAKAQKDLEDANAKELQIVKNVSVTFCLSCFAGCDSLSLANK